MQSILLKRKVMALLFMLQPLAGSVAQTYMGNVEFTSQSGINSWDPGWKTVTGNIYVTSVAGDVITSLAPLQNLTTVGGAIIISENHSLTSLNGLGKVTSAGALEISFNSALQDISGLGTLTTVSGSVNINGNASLATLTGLNNNLSINGDLSIRNNPALSFCNITPVCNYQKNHPSFTYLNVSGNAGSCFSESTLYTACNGPLPVVLTEFEATGEGTYVLLRWSTAAETDAFQFDVERSRDGQQWGKIGEVKALGESRELSHYDYTDAYPWQGENLYRLRINDLDGSYAYSRVRSVRVRNIAAPAYPNPFSTSLFLSATSLTRGKSLELINSHGKTVYEVNGRLPASIPTHGWPPGIYILKLSGEGGGSQNFRIVKAE
nr:T9SS type A sorting domain-containing protein [uncultured Dyadobacter sp.]